jgi:hypothetical protein
MRMKTMCWTGTGISYFAQKKLLFSSSYFAKRSCFSVVHILHKRSCFFFKDRHRLEGELLTLFPNVSEVTRCHRKRLMSPETTDVTRSVGTGLLRMRTAFCKCEELTGHSATLQRHRTWWITGNEDVFLWWQVTNMGLTSAPTIGDSADGDDHSGQIGKWGPNNFTLNHRNNVVC